MNEKRCICELQTISLRERLELFYEELTEVKCSFEKAGHVETVNKYLGDLERFILRSSKDRQLAEFHNFLVEIASTIAAVRTYDARRSRVIDMLNALETRVKTAIRQEKETEKEKKAAKAHMLMLQIISNVHDLEELQVLSENL